MNLRILAAALAAATVTGTVLAGSAQAHPWAPQGAQQPAAPVTLPVGPRPESITKGWDGRFYVSIQGAPDLGLNDGEIRTFDPDTGAVTTFVTGLDNPRGLAFTGKLLVVTDTTVVWIIDRTGGKPYAHWDGSFGFGVHFSVGSSTPLPPRTCGTQPGSGIWFVAPLHCTL